MNNQGNNSHRFPSQDVLRPSQSQNPRPSIDVSVSNGRTPNQAMPNVNPLRQSQRPLIDVAISYGRPRIPAMSRESNFVAGTGNEMKENNSIPVSSLGYSAVSSQGRGPYTWRAKSDTSNASPVPAETLSSPRNPYSWKASSKPTATATASTATTATESRGSNPADFPRAPRLPLPKSMSKLEPLTVSKNSETRTVIEGPQQSPNQQVPLQPFCSTGNSMECTCLRNSKVILCQSCGHIQKGRLSMACKVHPRQMFLMDLHCCTGCKSNSLKEICDAKKC